jgi:NADP-dependent 3-hydroxy acid dehydrogenase YdfG
LAGRTKASLEAAARQSTASGSEARTAGLDVLDDAGVSQFLDGVVKQTGRIDVVLDATGPLPSSTETESWPSGCRSKNSWYRSRRWYGRALSPRVPQRVT